jgi:hypothetical protein
VGSRIRENLDQTLRRFLRANPDVVRGGDIIMLRERSILARSPGDGVERKVTEIPPEERKKALLSIIGESPGIEEAELITVVSRFFGWLRRGSDITRELARDISELAKADLIEGRPHRIIRS